VPDLPSGNAAIGQSGGPTAVINQSLAGVVEGLKAGLAASGKVKRILGMRHGVRGLVKSGSDGLVDLTGIDAAKLEAIARTPSAALGSTRDKPDEAYCERILAGARANDIRYFFYIGGNDSADTCRIVSEMAAAAGYELRCFHVPKTIDNDLLENDHTPGFPSAARFVSLALIGDALDNASLGGIKINVIMGRNAGFLTAAASLARGQASTGAAPADRPAPHLIYLPEVPFSTDAFLADVEAVYAKLGRCQIAVSEGIRDERVRMTAIREMADEIVDTSDMSVHELRQFFMGLSRNRSRATLMVTILSFGYKLGVPVEADLMFDARCLPNPYFVPALRRRTGRDRAVAAFMERDDSTREFIDRLESYLRYVVPHYVAEGKSYLTVAIGCTGGRHRSVMIAERLRGVLTNVDGARVRVRHRDIGNA